MLTQKFYGRDKIKSNLQTNISNKVPKAFRILLLILSLLAFGLFIISLLIYDKLAFLELTIILCSLFLSILLFVSFILSKYTEIRVNKDQIEKITFYKSKQIHWNNVGEIFEEISSDYPKKKLGHIIICSKNNGIKIRVDSYITHFDEIQKLVKNKSSEFVKITINKKLGEDKKVDFFYSNFYKIGYLVFIIAIFILAILPVLLNSINLVNIIMEVILMYFLIKGGVKFLRSREVIQLSKDKIVKLMIFNKRCYRLHDIRGIYINGKKDYQSIATIIFRNNKKLKIESKISNYWMLLSHLCQATNLQLHKGSR